MLLKHSNKSALISISLFFDLIKRTLLLFALLISANSFATEQNGGISLESNQSVVLSNNTDNFSHIPLHPTSPSPIPESPAESDDNEEQDGFDDDFKIGGKSLVLNTSSKSKILFDSLLQSFSNRNSISLVILYQSWKNFIV